MDFSTKDKPMEPVEIIDSLGRCECGKIYSVTDFAHYENMNGRWLCTCGKELDHLSFGYDKATTGARKNRWIGPDGNWTSTRPQDDFKLQDTHVFIERPMFRY